MLLSFGISARTEAPPQMCTGPGSTHSTPGRERKAVALRQLEDDGCNGNLAGDELAVLELLQEKATLERLQALTKHTRVTVAHVDALKAGVEAWGTEGQGGQTEAENEDLKNVKLNIQLREVFASRFINMFADYDAFVIQSAPDLESWLTNREQMHNFDKVTKSSTLFFFFVPVSLSKEKFLSKTHCSHGVQSENRLTGNGH